MLTENIVCLANSRKLGGRCIAGLLWEGGRFSRWVRPISKCGKGELHNERLYVNGEEPQLLDIVELSLGSPRAVGCHSEDYLNSASMTWKKVGNLPFGEAEAYSEPVVGPLWTNSGSTYGGENDSIPESEAVKLNSSLKLIQPDRLEMIATSEGGNFGNPKRKVRGSFNFGRHHYLFSITDPLIEAEFASQSVGCTREIESPLLCLSISEVFDKQNACYKLIAGVMEA